MVDISIQGSLQALSNEGMISSRIACTNNVRVEFLRCRPETTVRWSVARPEFSLMWVRDNDHNARITLVGGESNSIAPGQAHFWFFPEGVDAQGELTGKGAYDCAGVFIDPSFLSSSAKRALAEPMTGFSHAGLGRAFDELADELAEPDEVLPLFTDGWAMQALAYVARASRTPEPTRVAARSGLAPWQLRRAKEIFRTDLSDNLTLQHVAEACRLSVSHFARAFKVSTGVPPHQWLMTARVEMARELLTRSPMPLVEVAGTCGFADQSHFSRVFARIVGTSPGAWRREHRSWLSPSAAAWAACTGYRRNPRAVNASR
jgi:AraC-like DNA-binding protein